MLFSKIYIKILFQSKLADKIYEDFINACKYFTFLSQITQNEYSWQKSNTTKFKFNIKNNFENIQLLLTYNNQIIKKEIIIVDLNSFGQNFLSNKIRNFLNEITKNFLLSKVDNKLDIDKFLNVIKE